MIRCQIHKIDEYSEKFDVFLNYVLIIKQESKTSHESYYCFNKII